MKFPIKDFFSTEEIFGKLYFCAACGIKINIDKRKVIAC